MNFCSAYAQNLMIYALSTRRFLPSSFALFRMLTLTIALPTELRRNGTSVIVHQFPTFFNPQNSFLQKYFVRRTQCHTFL